jgi:hypothetical protein
LTVRKLGKTLTTKARNAWVILTPEINLGVLLGDSHAEDGLGYLVCYSAAIRHVAEWTDKLLDDMHQLLSQETVGTDGT